MSVYSSTLAPRASNVSMTAVNPSPSRFDRLQLLNQGFDRQLSLFVLVDKVVERLRDASAFDKQASSAVVETNHHR